jgi:hypothetical protein
MDWTGPDLISYLPTQVPGPVHTAEMLLLTYCTTATGPGPVEHVHGTGWNGGHTVYMLLYESKGLLTLLVIALLCSTLLYSALLYSAPRHSQSSSWNIRIYSAAHAVAFYYLPHS